jgi:hypothetical protein
MSVNFVLRDGVTVFKILKIELEVENGVPQYPDTIVCDKTYRVWLRKPTPCQGKPCYDLVSSFWLTDGEVED